MPRIPLDTMLPPDTQGGPLIERQSTLGEVAQASFLEGINSAETSSIVRTIKLGMMSRQDDIMDHNELNKKFPEIDVPFNQPTSLSAAEEMAKRARERKLRQKIIAEGDQDSVAHSVVSFGANMIPQALDPVGIAAGLVLGGGITKTMGFLSKSGKVGAQLARVPFASRVAEGVAGNLLAEAVFVQPASRMEQADVDTYESLTNAVVGGIAFPVVLGAAGKTIDFLKGGKRGVDKMTKAHTLAESQAQLGKKVNLEDYATAEKKAELPEMRDRLETLREQEPESPEIAIMERDISDIEKLPDPDRAQVAERANSPEEDLYFDPIARQKFDDAERGLEQTDFSTERREKFDFAQEQIKELEAEGEFSPADLKEIEQVRAEFAQIDKINELTKAATVCLRGNA